MLELLARRMPYFIRPGGRVADEMSFEEGGGGGGAHADRDTVARPHLLLELRQAERGLRYLPILLHLCTLVSATADRSQLCRLWPELELVSTTSQDPAELPSLWPTSSTPSLLRLH